MNKKELVVKVAEAMSTEEKKVTQKAASEYVNAIIDVITEALVAGDEVSLTGFGKFSVTERAAREGRNPATGETIQIAASKSPKFKAAKALKDAVNE
jgi:DNA-binding protein HU-beta